MTLGLPVSTIFAFLLVMARVAGLVIFLPVPGFRNAPEVIRAVLVLALTFALFPVWPQVPDVLPSFGQLIVWVFCEAGFGLMAGVAIAFLTEGFQVASQMLGMQAGYGFASTIDPTNQADAGIIQVMMSLTTGLLFFSLGFDRALLRVLAASFQTFPAGSWAPSAASLDGIMRLGSGMFAVGLRLALPVSAMLVLIDLALALLGRMHQQLHLLTIAFPMKMLAALGLLIALVPVIARIFDGAGERTMRELWSVLAQAHTLH
jgi:flagellar biosynthetic protein FliR